MPMPLLLLTRWEAYEHQETIENFIQEALNKQATLLHYGFALPYYHLKELSRRPEYANVRFGALEMLSVEDTAFTKSIAAKMLKEAGASFVLIGTDVERHALGEKNGMFNHKIKEALAAGIMPILCVGATADEHLAGKGEAIIDEQLKEGLEGLSSEQLQQTTIFFESPWMNQVPYRPSPEEVTKEYQRDHDILANIVTKKAAEMMQIIHRAPEDLMGFEPPTGKGIFLHHHFAQELPDSVVEALSRVAEQVDSEEAERSMEETARQLEEIAEEEAAKSPEELPQELAAVEQEAQAEEQHESREEMAENAPNAKASDGSEEVKKSSPAERAEEDAEPLDMNGAADLPEADLADMPEVGKAPAAPKPKAKKSAAVKEESTDTVNPKDHKVSNLKDKS